MRNFWEDQPAQFPCPLGMCCMPWSRTMLGMVAFQLTAASSGIVAFVMKIRVSYDVVVTSSLGRSIDAANLRRSLCSCVRTPARAE